MTNFIQLGTPFLRSKLPRADVIICVDPALTTGSTSSDELDLAFTTQGWSTGDALRVNFTDLSTGTLPDVIQTGTGAGTGAGWTWGSTGSNIIATVPDSTNQTPTLIPVRVHACSGSWYSARVEEGSIVNFEVNNIKSPASTRSVGLGLFWYTEDGTFFDQDNSTQSGNPSGALHALAAAAPANAYWVRGTITINSGSGRSVDGIRIEVS